MHICKLSFSTLSSHKCNVLRIRIQTHHRMRRNSDTYAKSHRYRAVSNNLHLFHPLPRLCILTITEPLSKVPKLLTVSKAPIKLSFSMMYTTLHGNNYIFQLEIRLPKISFGSLRWICHCFETFLITSCFVTILAYPLPKLDSTFPLKADVFPLNGNMFPL